MLPNYLANSYFPEELLEYADMVYLGARSAQGTLVTAKSTRENALARTLILGARDQSLDALDRLVNLGATTRSAAAAQERLVQFDRLFLPTLVEVIRGRPVDDVRSDRVWEAVLHPETDTWGRTLAEPGEVFEKWVAYVRSLGGEVNVEFRRVVANGLAFVPIQLPDARLDEVARFNPLRAIRPMPSLQAFPTFTRMATTPRPIPSGASVAVGAPRIAIFDGGIDDTSPFFAGIATNDDLTPEPRDPDDFDHGTAVTSTLLYGRVMPGATLGAPAGSVAHYRVLPPPAIHRNVQLYWVLDRIRDVLRQEDFDIVNLSLGPYRVAEIDREPDRWTAELDDIAYERNVLIMVAVGNNGDKNPTLGLNRLQIPADIINGVGVGACDTTGASWQRASYSAIGPGRAGARIQPTGVAFGGSTAEFFPALLSDGSVGLGWGTSLATPLAGHGLAHLATQLGPDHLKPNTLRAFAVHFSEPGSGRPMTHVGYGRLNTDYTADLATASNGVSVLYEGEIARDEQLALPLPLPLQASHVLVRLSWTLVAASPIEPTDPLEYSRCGLEVRLRPNENVRTYTDPDTNEKGKTINLETDRARYKALAGRGVVFSHPKSKPTSVFRAEAQLRDQGKWETVQHSPRKGHRDSLRYPCLELTYYARRSGMLVLGAAVPKLAYSLIVSLEVPGHIDLHGLVRAQYTSLTPITARPQAQIRP
jgi:hypothetical protein